MSGIAIGAAQAAPPGANAAATNAPGANPGRLSPPGPFLTPVAEACVSSPFGPRILPNRPLAGTFHPGIDLPAPEGAPVRAVAPGEVIRVQRHGPGGLEMLVQHAGFIGVYSHLGHVAPVIAEGRRTVFGGQQIGVVGRTGVTYGMHLYFGMIVDGRSVDPAHVLGISACGSTEARAHPMDGPRPPSRIYYAGR